MLSQIKLPDTRLSAQEELALCRMINKRESYVEQGRFRDAHGLGTGIWILWATLTGSIEVEQKTNIGDLA